MRISPLESRTQLVIVRHGDSDANRDNSGQKILPKDDRGLTELGIQQSKELANTLNDQGDHLTFLWHSPLRRAKETADILATPDMIRAGFGVLQETPYGTLAGQLKGQITPDDFAILNGSYFSSPLGSEPLKCINARSELLFAMSGFIFACSRKVEKPVRIVLVTHGGFAHESLGYLAAIRGGIPVQRIHPAPSEVRQTLFFNRLIVNLERRPLNLYSASEYDAGLRDAIKRDSGKPKLVFKSENDEEQFALKNCEAISIPGEILFDQKNKVRLGLELLNQIAIGFKYRYFTRNDMINYAYTLKRLFGTIETK